MCLPTYPLIAEPDTCEWCDNAITVSVNWECGDACAMCAQCFGPTDDRDWTMDIMDWSSEPSQCPSCAG